MMLSKLVRGQNFKKYKLHDQTKINITKSPYISQKLKSKKWYFFTSFIAIFKRSDFAVCSKTSN